ncbi:hypothetical protein [Paludisphaera soli]|uniref:hypothetical protein n=1 Tax=Paludisphaera soli TaxID=2712865 RepID=UPI0013ED5E09|nr:hypothetical protein [Paludisphaera soli]
MGAPWRIFWLLVLGFHAVGAAGWWWLAPGGFPVADPLSWRNRVAPPLVLALVVSSVFWSRRPDGGPKLAAALGALPIAWLAGAMVLLVGFRTGLRDPLFLAPAAFAAVLAAAHLGTFRRRASGATSARWAVGLRLGAVAFGLLTAAASLPRPAGTRPASEPHSLATLPREDVNARLGPDAFVQLGEGSTSLKAGRLRLTVQPLLRFLERSPDGRPTVLVPRAEREGRDSRLIGSAATGGGLDLRYRSDFDASLQVEARDDRTIWLESLTILPIPVWSHLNSFCDVDVTGHRRLSLSFSPCPDARIGVEPMDYPFGRPLRFAFLEASGRFRIVEATSGEKGPFRELASGPLGRGEPLAVTFHDEDRAVARLTLDDWSAQLDVQLSPTAGWLAPVNAIEFCLAGDEPTSTASIYMTLAGTSVGRGWDCVGHRAGAYRNRIRVEILDPP